MSEEELSGELAALEAALASLVPNRSGLDRDRVMFLAGRASAGNRPPDRRRTAHWLWPCATAASLLAAVTLGAMLLKDDRPQVAEDAAEAEADNAPEGVDEDLHLPPIPIISLADPPAGYLRLRQLVLAHGVDAIPEPTTATGNEIEVPKWTPGYSNGLDQLLGG